MSVTKETLIGLYNSIRGKLSGPAHRLAIASVTQLINTDELDQAYNQLKSLELHVLYGYPVYLQSDTAPDHEWLGYLSPEALRKEFLALHAAVIWHRLTAGQRLLVEQAIKLSLNGPGWVLTGCLLLHGLEASILHGEPSPVPLPNEHDIPPAIEARAIQAQANTQLATRAVGGYLGYLRHIYDKSFTYWMAGRMINHLDR